MKHLPQEVFLILKKSDMFRKKRHSNVTLFYIVAPSKKVIDFFSQFNSTMIPYGIMLIGLACPKLTL